MDIFDSISKSWSEFTHWVGFEESKEADTAASSQETPAEEHIPAPSPEDVLVAERFQKKAARLEELAKFQESRGNKYEADLLRFKAQVETDMARGFLNFNRDLFSRENLERVNKFLTEGSPEYRQKKEQELWIVQRLKETLPYLIWKKYSQGSEPPGSH